MAVASAGGRQRLAFVCFVGKFDAALLCIDGYSGCGRGGGTGDPRGPDGFSDWAPRIVDATAGGLERGRGVGVFLCLLMKRGTFPCLAPLCQYDNYSRPVI